MDIARDGPRGGPAGGPPDGARDGQPPLLALSGVTRRFGGLTAVEDLDLVVDVNEIVVRAAQQR